MSYSNIICIRCQQPIKVGETHEKVEHSHGTYYKHDKCESIQYDHQHLDFVPTYPSNEPPNFTNPYEEYSH